MRKKVILIMDLGLENIENDKPVKSEESETPDVEPEKIEIPQDIIDKVSKDEKVDEDDGSTDSLETSD